VGFSETHRFGKSTPPGLFNANEGEPHGDARSARVPASLPDVPDVRADFADYAVSATRLDDKIGQVFDALKRNGLWGDTLVIATTDHGLAFPGMKCTCRDAGLGVMLILRGPGVEGGRASDALVSQIDLFPTLCDLLGIAPPAWLQGRSLMPVLRGESEGVNDAIFGEVTYHGAYDPQRAVRTTRWKYIRGWHETPRPLLMNCDDGLSRRWMAEHGGAEQFLDAEALYDLTFDSNETHNLAADPAHAAMRDEMRARLETWLRDTNDPLLNGPVPPSQPPSAA
jgi:arylsulfatase A-like enzyme